MNKMIGRVEELETLQEALNSEISELVAVTGRRRIGKTYLVRTFFEDRIDFEMVGLKDGNKEQQLRNFAYSLKAAKHENEPPEFIPKDWLEAFHELTLFLEETEQRGKKQVVFIDELPWAATAKSGFLTGFGYFWNSYASKKNIVVVICGSATSWMIQKVINDKGGLHNRVTQKIQLNPFSLSETELYLKSKHITLDHYQILQLYMAMGGIPHYLNQVKKGKTAAQNINDICFYNKGILRDEFKNLYRALFVTPERHEKIVRALASTWKGLSRTEILKITGLKDGGGITTILTELEQSGFITSYVPFNKKIKDSLFRLTDNYSLFYLKFIENLSTNEVGSWMELSQTQSWKTWSGYAFENICFQHIDKIKAALGISGIYSSQSSFYSKATEKHEGTQIDMLIDRADLSISLCEVKFYNNEMKITKEMATRLRQKRRVFQEVSRCRKQIFIALITTFGLVHNEHSLGLIDNVIDMDSLF